MSSAERLDYESLQETEQQIAKKRKRIAAYLAMVAFVSIASASQVFSMVYPDRVVWETRTREELTNPFDGNVYFLTEDILLKTKSSLSLHGGGNSIEMVNKSVEGWCKANRHGRLRHKW